MGKVTLAPNLPVRFAVKYADVIPTQYGEELRLKGSTPDDASAVLYARWADACTALVACGALAGPPALPDPLPEKGHALKLAFKDLVVTKAQGAGDKHGVVTFARPGAAPNPVPPPGRVSDALPAPAAAAPAPTSAPRKSLAALYLEVTDFVLDKVAKRYEAAGVPTEAPDFIAAAGSIFTARARQEGY